LKGRYSLVLEVSLEDLSARANADGEPASLENVQADLEEAVLRRFNEGLRKLGLQLERRKGPVESLVVDRLEKGPTAN